MPLITKQDLIDRTRISAQLSDRQVLPFIEDAETYDLPTLLSGNLIAEIHAFNITALAWANETPYGIGLYATYGTIYYKALQDTTGVIPGSDAAYWQADYKATLRYNHLPEFLIWSAYSRMLLEIGRTPTEAGLTVASDPEGTYQQASDKARAELMQSAKDKANFHRAEVERFLVKHNLITRDSCAPTYRRSSGRITAI